MTLTRKEKERKERDRQIVAIRKYNQRKCNIYETRLSKFLKLYPYTNNGNLHNMETFIKGVENADFDKLNMLIESFNEENSYWSTYYVLHNCNRSVHSHILRVLSYMYDSLSKRINCLNSENKIANQNDNANVVINNWGKQGEKEVDYVLKWLPENYVIINKNCKNKYGEDCILLKNIGFIDEKQEYDHIVVGPQGIFVIETKNYSGKLYIDNEGNWIRMKKRQNEWTPEVNPTQQVNRHHVLLESIVGSDIPIIDIICLAHPDLMVVGQDNSKIKVVKKDLLGDYIMNYPGEIFDNYEVEDLVCQIDTHKLK